MLLYIAVVDFCCVVFYWMNISWFICSPVDGKCRLSPVLKFLLLLAVLLLQILLYYLLVWLYKFPGYMPRSELLSPHLCLAPVLLDKATLLSTVSLTSYTFNCSILEFSFCHQRAYQLFDAVRFKNFSHLVAHCFIWYLPDWNMVGYNFVCLLAI